MPILEATGITKTIDTGTHRVEILRGVDLELPAGQFVAIMGQIAECAIRKSNSGKSRVIMSMMVSVGIVV